MTTHEIKLHLHKCEMHAAPRVTIRRGDNGTQKIDAIIDDATDYAAGTICRFKVLHRDCTWAQSSAEWDGEHAVTTLSSDVLNGNGPCNLAYFEFVKPSTEEGGENLVETTSNLELYLMQDIDVTDKQARGYSEELERLYKALNGMEDKLEVVKNNAIVATTNANKAADDALSATEYAGAAATKANIATDKANEAADKANEAAERVDDAITDITQLKKEATEATEKANIAAEDADEAAKEARELNDAYKLAEAARVIAEEHRVEAEDKRVIEFEEMIKQMKSLKIHICEGTEYDEVTRKPTLVGDPTYIYLTPATKTGVNDHYYEWIYLNETFEKIGSTDATYDPMTTEIIDAILAGETKTGSEVATTTAISYIYKKLNLIYAEKEHTHKKADITDFEHTHKKIDITDFEHTHVKADITDLVLGEGVLTVKQGDTTKGTFSANSTENATIKIDEYEHPEKSGWYHVPSGGATNQHLEWKADGQAKWVDPTSQVTLNDKSLVTSGGVYNAIGRGTLTVKQGDDVKGTFSANADTNVTVKIDEYEHPTESGWKHIPKGGATNNILTYAADGTAQWTLAEDEVTENSTKPVSSGAVFEELKEYAPLDSPAFVNTPTAPTATAGTNTTQIATTAFVTDAIETAITEVENGYY